MEQAQAFGPVTRTAAAVVLCAGAIFAACVFGYQFRALWEEARNDIHVAPSLDDALHKREKWVHTVRAAAAMREHCDAVLARARAQAREVLAYGAQVSGAKRWPAGVQAALLRKAASQRETVRPCESAELFLKLQGAQPGFFPRAAGSSRFFASAAKALAFKGGAPGAEIAARLGDEFRQWDELPACANDPKPRSVLGVVVRPRTWYVAVEGAPPFRGTTTEAWVWLAGTGGQKNRRSL